MKNNNIERARRHTYAELSGASGSRNKGTRMGVSVGKWMLCAIFPALLAVSCAKDDTAAGPVSAPGGEIEFEIGFAPQSRVVTDAAFESRWEDGDAIGIFAVEHGKGVSLTGENVINNVKLTYNLADDKWTAAEQMWWPAGETKLDFYAYYPYHAVADILENFVFEVYSDQSASADDGRSHYNLSDMLTAMSDNGGEGCVKNVPVPLTFSHAMAMVQVSVPYVSKGFGPSASLEVFLEGVKSKVKLDFTNMSTGGSGVYVAPYDNDPKNIKMFRVEQPEDANYATSYTYRALVPTQLLPASHRLIRFYHEQRQVFNSERLYADLQLKAGVADIFSYSLDKAVHTVPIVAGTFKMGSSDGSNLGGNPLTELNTTPAEPGREMTETQHWVTLSKDFRMGAYEVTVGQYAAFLNNIGVSGAGIGRNQPVEIEVEGYGKQTAFEVDRVVWSDAQQKWIPNESAGYTMSPTWYGAKAYADWVGGSLPTEAQWEYACRAGTTTAFFYGSDDIDDLATFQQYIVARGAFGHDVGSKLPNPWGLYDMGGSGLEWCHDWYLDDYYNDPQAGLDPTGPAFPTGVRSMRGGSFVSEPKECRSASRASMLPNAGGMTYGFRVVFL